MGGHKTHSQTSYGTPTRPPTPPPPPVPDYNVTGDPNPDCKCNYFLAGTYNGMPYYRRSDGLYFLFWHVIAVNYWGISNILDGTDILWRNFASILGSYTPAHGCSGNPFVSAGGH